jgi:hypothetical protein
MLFAEDDDESLLAELNGDDHPRLRNASATGALILVVLTGVLVAGQPTQSDPRPAADTTRVLSAASPTGSLSPASGTSSPSRTWSRLVPVDPGVAGLRSRLSWSSDPEATRRTGVRGIASPCVFRVRLQPIGALREDLLPMVTGPRGVTLSGDTTDVLRAGIYQLRVTASGCQWRFRFDGPGHSEPGMQPVEGRPRAEPGAIAPGATVRSGTR